jgi:hypothetical protein
MGCVGPFPDYYPIPTYDKDFADNPYKNIFNVSSTSKKTDVYLYNIKSKFCCFF